LGQALFEQHDGAEHGAQGSEESTDDGFHGGVLFQKEMDEVVQVARAFRANAPNNGP
jgi:hypothetical protein